MLGKLTAIVVLALLIGLPLYVGVRWALGPGKSMPRLWSAFEAVCNSEAVFIAVPVLTIGWLIGKIVKTFGMVGEGPRKS